MSGRHLGVYRLDALLGSGGMGEVYRAYDERRDRPVALKLLAPQVSADPAFAHRFDREARITARLAEPHIIPIHDFGRIDGQYFIDMRLVEGMSLRELLTAQGPLPPERAVAIVRQVASALDAAHDAGLVHRDVKPDNVLLGSHDFAYLVDFGIAVDTLSTRLTSTGMTIGTLAYMAPERLQGEPPAPAGDIYSLGLMLRECLTGNPPRLQEADPDVDQIDPSLAAVVAQATATDPAARPSRASALAAAAQQALSATPPTELPTPKQSPTKRLPTAGAVDPGADPASPATPGSTPLDDGSEHEPHQPRRRTAVLVAAFLALAVALGVLWLQLDPLADDSTTGATNPPGPTTLLPSASSSASPTGPPRATSSGTATVVTLEAGQQVWFASSTGYTACRISTDEVRCISPVRRFAVPSGVPERCGSSIVLNPAIGEPRFSCAGTAEFAAAGPAEADWATRSIAVSDVGVRLPVLGNGRSLTAGQFRCEMSPDYVRCTDTATETSFRIARSQYAFSTGTGLPVAS